MKDSAADQSTLGLTHPRFESWRELLSKLGGVEADRRASAVHGWRLLLSQFATVRDAAQAAVGEPSAALCTFNIFKATQRRDFEVTTHSALLGNLLDPPRTARAALF
jgi:hypothetical protein